MTLTLFPPDIQYGGFKPTEAQESNSYGSPQADPVSAPDSYGSPQAPPVSAPDSYGSPQAPPVSAPDSYGSPQADPISPGSGSSSLSGRPLPPAGVSIDTPVESFIPQVGRNPPDIAKAKSSKAIPNSNNYDPFDYQDQVSWSFF